MFKDQLLQDLKDTVKDLGFVVPPDIVLSIPQNPKFGDYSSNIPLQLSKQTHKNSYQNPQQIANAILKTLGHPAYLEHVEVAGPGFINFFIKDSSLAEILEPSKRHPELVSGSKKKILIEYGHVNLLKEIHIGHLRTFILGESLARILEYLGNDVFRANYQGDIGLHIAKAVWGIRKLGLPSQELSLEDKAKFLGQPYAQGNLDYDQDHKAKHDIDSINLKLYEKAPEFEEVYKLAREWSLEYFSPIYDLLGIKYDRCFFESEVYEEGKKIVLENVGKVFKQDNGAIVFPGEEYGLHTRVFIASKGNPTYEAKDIGLAQAEFEAFPYDLSIHVVASEQEGYFKVVIKAIEILFPHLVGKKYHLSYGFVDLKEGKMSSRTGNVITVDDLMKVVSEKLREVMSKSKGQVDQEIVKKLSIAAIKFSYLKVSPTPNLTFDLDSSVSLTGDSGPYVMYSFVRTQSILKKANKDEFKFDPAKLELSSHERELLRLLEYFNYHVEQASINYHPNEIASYLIELSKLFNSFYESTPILNTKEENFRLSVVKKVGETLKTGLNLLGIETVEKM